MTVMQPLLSKLYCLGTDKFHSLPQLGNLLISSSTHIWNCEDDKKRNASGDEEQNNKGRGNDCFPMGQSFCLALKT